MSDIIINTPDRKWLAIAAATSAIEAAAVLSRLGHEDNDPDDDFSGEVVMKLIDALKMSIDCLPAEAACNFSSLSRDLAHELEYWI